MQLSKKTINIKAYLLFKDFFLMLVCKTNLKMSVSKKKKKRCQCQEDQLGYYLGNNLVLDVSVLINKAHSGMTVLLAIWVQS